MTTIATLPVDEFPECPGYGFNAQPQYLVKINPREGGFESVKKRWPRPISFYTAVPVGDRDEETIQNILNFWHCQKGRAKTFRLKDWTDYKSCPVQADETATDQPLVFAGTDDDDNDFYRLQKRYTFGVLTQIRDITQPIGDSLLIANEDGDLQDPSTYFVDESSGLLTVTTGFVGTPNSWGGQFMVPVRFDSELDIAVADKRIQSVGFTLKEKRQILRTQFEIPAPTGAVPMDFTARTPLAVSGSAAILACGNSVFLGASGVSGTIIKSADDGLSWSNALTGAANNITSLASNEIPNSLGTGTTFLAGAAGGKVYRSTDSGSTWSSPITVGSIGAIKNIVHQQDGGTTWLAIGDDGAHYAVSTDDGLTWTGHSFSAAFLPGTLYFFNDGTSHEYIALANVAGVLNFAQLANVSSTWSLTAIGSYPVTTKTMGFAGSPSAVIVGGGASLVVRASFGATGLPFAADVPITFSGADTAIAAVAVFGIIVDHFVAFGDLGSVANFDSPDGSDLVTGGALHFSGTHTVAAAAYNYNTSTLMVTSDTTDVSVVVAGS